MTLTQNLNFNFNLDLNPKANVNVSFEAHVNAAGVEQPGCTLCGDCNTGCNVGAKNTVLMNYLPSAVKSGADIYCNIEVDYIEQTGIRRRSEEDTESKNHQPQSRTRVKNGSTHMGVGFCRGCAIEHHPSHVERTPPGRHLFFIAVGQWSTATCWRTRVRR